MALGERAARRDVLEQACVHDRDGDLVGETLEHVGRIGREWRAAVEHVQRADRAIRGGEWHDDDVPDGRRGHRRREGLGVR